MKKPVVAVSLLLIPAVLIILGFYLGREILSSIGYVVLIFYIIMAVRGRFSDRDKNKEQV